MLLRAAALLLGALLAGCSGRSGGSGENNDAACRDGLDNDGDGLPDCQDPECAGTASCPADPRPDAFVWRVDGCGGEFYKASNVPPNMLIVLDRSGSMNEKIGEVSKWSIAVEAIEKLLSSHGAKIRFGLMLYPGSDETCSEGGTCGAGKAFVNVSPTALAAISELLGRVVPCSVKDPEFRTPTGATLATLTTYAPLKDASRTNHVMLVTDGKENCSGDPPRSAAELLSQSPSIRTFVVGFGGEVDAAELSAIAEAGGTARTTSPAYYQADNPTSLQSAFSSIASAVVSCTYTLSGTPPDPSLLYVYQDKVPVNRDQSKVDGWNYDTATKQLTFYGPACDKLKSGQVKELIIVFGCPFKIE